MERRLIDELTYSISSDLTFDILLTATKQWLVTIVDDVRTYISSTTPVPSQALSRPNSPSNLVILHYPPI